MQALPTAAKKSRSHGPGVTDPKMLRHYGIQRAASSRTISAGLRRRECLSKSVNPPDLLVNERVASGILTCTCVVHHQITIPTFHIAAI